VAKDKKVSRHRRVGQLFLEEISFLGALAESGFCEVDLIHIGARSGHALCRGKGHEQKQRKKQQASFLQSFLQ
jgi:hypothetical protein